MPECWDDVVALAVPALRERGLHETAYRPGTLRRKLFGRGDRLSRSRPNLGAALDAMVSAGDP